MKKLYTLFLLSFLFFNTPTKAQWVNIPDANFVAYLTANYPSAMSGSMMDTTNSSIVNATSLTCSSLYIHNLSGVEYFDNLDSLICSNNPITSLTSLPQSIKVLICRNPQLTNLPTLPNSLQTLDTYSCILLTNLPTLPASLQILQCGNNALSSLPTLPASLQYLSCYSNQLTSLPLLPSTIAQLHCNVNHLASLPLLPSSLLFFDCSDNQLTALPSLPNSITHLYCETNNLGSLPPLPNSLVDLECNNNQILSLPSLPNLLSTINCSFNQLTSLPSLPNSLSNLICNNNQLISLPPLNTILNSLACNYNQLANLPTLPFSLDFLDCSFNINLNCLPDLKYVNNLTITGTGINCLPNRGHLTGSWLTYPLCDVFNTHGCNFYWNIDGTIYWDYNLDCINNTGDVVVKNQKINLYDNGVLQQQVFTRTNGEYTFDVNMYDTFTYSLDTLGLPFSVSCPNNNLQTSIISALDSTDTGMDFGFHCNAAKTDVGVLSMVRDSGNVRPTRVATIKINAGDMAHLLGGNCPNTSSGQLTVTINGQATYQGVVSGAIPPTTVSGNTLTWNIANWGAVNLVSDFHIRIKTDTFAIAGQQICITAIATTTGTNFITSNDTLTHCFNIVNSFDPNEKEVSVKKYIAPGFNDWLVYTVHFQNTGNAPAIDILVKDTLDSNLAVSTFQLLGASADNFTQVLPGGIVHFNFPNINLIDSLTNEPLSHGWVQYKVKLNSGLPLGTHINNTAAIYFDFNPPIYTNKTTNIISNLLCNDTYAPIVSQTICSSQTYPWAGNNLNTTGIYYDTIPNFAGCDSILTLNLTVIQPTMNNLAPVTICSPQAPYIFGSHSTALYSSGTYYDTLVSYTACDSLDVLQFTVNQPSSTNINATICGNQYYWFLGHKQTIPGQYFDTLVNYMGCDSFVTLNLNVHPGFASFTTIQGAICNGTPYHFGNQTLTVAGTYYDTLVNYMGCDSIVTLFLNVSFPVSSSVFANLCQGTPYNFNGTLLTTSGTYYDTLTTFMGCDSAITLTLVINPFPPTSSTVYDTICQNSYIIFHGQFCFSAGTYTATITNYHGCDSVITLNLYAIPNAYVNMTDSFCQGGTYQIGQYTLSFPSTYGLNIGTKANGCDSLVMLTLTVKVNKPTVDAGPDVHVCAGQACTLTATGCVSYSWSGGFANGAPFYPGATTWYVVTGYGPNGCSDIDSVHVLIVSPPVQPTISFAGGTLSTSLTTLNIQWYFNGTAISGATSANYTPTASGVYRVCVTNTSGCKSCSNSLNIVMAGIGEPMLAEEGGLELYPNPADNVLICSCAYMLINTIQVYDVLGKEQGIYSPLQRGGGGFEIDVSKLTAGVYFIKVTDEKGNVRMGKFVKE